MKWSEARRVAQSGQRIRWRTWRYWWRQGIGALWFKETDSGQTVIQAGDVQKEYFLGDQWTTEEFSDSDLDPCAREAARKPEFFPPGVFVDASWADGTMTIEGGISEGSPGVYRLQFLINGTVVAHREADGSAKYSITVPAAYQAKWDVILLVESALPLDPWSDMALKIVRPTFAAFDFAIIRYTWSESGGRDLDTRTALVDVDASVNGDDVGWNRGDTVAGVSGNYLTWGGDNVDPAGTEAVLVDFTRIATDFPSLTYIRLRFRANWFGTRASGSFTLQFATYAGGTMVQVAKDFENSGGTLVTSLTKPGNVGSNVADNVDGELVGTLVFHVPTRTAVLE